MRSKIKSFPSGDKKKTFYLVVVNENKEEMEAI